MPIEALLVSWFISSCSLGVVFLFSYSHDSAEFHFRRQYLYQCIQIHGRCRCVQKYTIVVSSGLVLLQTLQLLSSRHSALAKCALIQKIDGPFEEVFVDCDLETLYPNHCIIYAHKEGGDHPKVDVLYAFRQKDEVRFSSPDFSHADFVTRVFKVKLLKYNFFWSFPQDALAFLAISGSSHYFMMLAQKANVGRNISYPKGLQGVTGYTPKCVRCSVRT